MIDQSPEGLYCIEYSHNWYSMRFTELKSATACNLRNALSGQRSDWLVIWVEPEPGSAEIFEVLDELQRQMEFGRYQPGPRRRRVGVPEIQPDGTRTPDSELWTTAH